MRFLWGVLWAALSLGGATAAPIGPPPDSSLPHSAGGWRDAARRDVRALYDLLLANHPGIFDPQNPGFAVQLRDAEANGLAVADKAQSAAGYVAAISRFNVTLADGHAGAVALLSDAQLPVKRWPGFVAAWRGDALVVYESEAGGPPVGARLLSCDGVAAKDLISRNVFAFDGRPSQPGNWWWQAGHLFVDGGNPFISVPQNCDFARGAGSQTIHLAWRPTNAHFEGWWLTSRDGDHLAPGLTEPRPDLPWIAMPTFAPEATERAAYAAMFATIRHQHGRFGRARAVVIDLRHNQGGSSDWSDEVAEALWGERTVDAAINHDQAGVRIWWRASPGNTAYMQGLVQKLRAQNQAEMAREFAPTAKGMARALAKGQKFYVEPAAPASGPAVAGRSRFTTPVYVIVPGQCSSACLDALDVFTLFPNTVLIGAPSSADSTYLEVRVQALPSGLALAKIPDKIWVGRKRAAGQFYTPKILVTAPSWSTAAFLDVIEHDLATRHRQKS